MDLKCRIYHLANLQIRDAICCLHTSCKRCSIQIIFTKCKGNFNFQKKFVFLSKNLRLSGSNFMFKVLHNFEKWYSNLLKFKVLFKLLSSFDRRISNNEPFSHMIIIWNLTYLDFQRKRLNHNTIFGLLSPSLQR